jgi:hypothetical protein
MVSQFEAEILKNEVVIVDVGDGHVYHLPILSNGTLSLNGAQRELTLTGFAGLYRVIENIKAVVS